MARNLIRSVRVDEDDENKPEVPGRIVTTLAKAKETRPYVEKLVTMARKAIPHEEEAQQYETDAERGSEEWRRWRNSEEWNRWNQAIAPAVALRRRAFALLRDKEAVDILFDELAERFEDRPGGYTRIIRLPQVRLGDAGRKVIFEFVGEPERDRVQRKRRAAPVVAEPEEDGAEAAAPDESETAESTQEPASDPESRAEHAEGESQGEQAEPKE